MRYYSFILFVFCLTICACKQNDDFTPSELSGINSRLPTLFDPLSDTSLFLDGSTGTDPALGPLARNYMQSTFVSAYSFSLWFKMNTVSTSLQGQFVKSDDNPQFQFSLGWLTGSNRIVYEHFFSNGGPVSLATLEIDIIDPQKWNHLVISYSHDSTAAPTQNTIRAYINGVLVGEDTVDAEILQWLGPRRIEFFPNNLPLSECLVDEMAFWVKELTLAEVQSLYGEGAPGNLTNTHSDFVSWWRMGETQALPTVPDQGSVFDFIFVGKPSLSSKYATPPTDDPFDNNSSDPLNDIENGDGTTGGGGSDPFSGGSGGFGGELGDGNQNGNFP